MVLEYSVSPETLEDQTEAQGVLAERLACGELMLVLGAGVSSSLGAPGWHELVVDCCNQASIKHKINLKRKEKSTDDDLRTLMSSVFSFCKDSSNSESEARKQYNEIVRSHLYKGMQNDLFLTNSSPLLLAVGSWLMGGQAGKVSDVVTYNFDNLLESFLETNGFTIQSIYDLPVLCNEVDVRVYHPHGFLPREGQGSRFLIFDQHSYALRLGDVEKSDNLWHIILRSILLQKQAVFIGLSGKDPVIPPLLSKVAHDLKQNNDGRRRHVGYWFCHSDTEDSVLRQIRDDWHCIPVKFENYNDIPRFMIAIRSQSARHRHESI